MLKTKITRIRVNIYILLYTYQKDLYYSMVLIPPLGPYKGSLFLAAVDRHIYGFWKKMTFKTFAYTVILYSGWAESCTLRGSFLVHWNLLRIWSANKGKSRTSNLPQSGKDLGKLIFYIVFLKEYLYSNLVALNPSKKCFAIFCSQSILLKGWSSCVIMQFF